MRTQVGWFAYAPGDQSSWSMWGDPQPVSGDERPAELADVGRLVRRLLRGLVRVARADEGVLLAGLLRAHLRGEVDELSVVDEAWRPYEHVNVQGGLDAWLAEPGRDHELIGVVGFQHREFGLPELLAESGPMALRAGNVARVNLPAGPGGAVRPCVRCGLYLVADGDRRTALLLRGVEPHAGQDTVTVQIASSDGQFAAQAAARIRELTVAHNVFRGQVLSFGGEVFDMGSTLLSFHERPRMAASELVLPADALAAIERQVVGVARNKQRLVAAGQHLKRGLLLYGPPGVGKTHTVRYLTSSLVGTTVIQLTGDALHLISEACSVARALAPAMVVVEDVDLIAEERGSHPGNHPMLFQLLNEMDGLAEDADVVFVLTTNRADLLEPALAARPGRVDQAVELPLPDRADRQALFELYRGRLEVDTSGLGGVLERTDGVTASFLKELLRRAAVQAAEHNPDSAPLRVSSDDLDAALDELLDTRNAMTRIVLGAARANGRSRNGSA